MKKIWEIFEWVLDKLKILGATCLVGMTALTCVDVVGRFFGHPVFGSVELVTFMATLSVALALPYTHQVKGHIGVEILVRLFSQKTQTIIELCTSFLSLGLFALITWRMVVYARTMQKSGEVSMNLELPQHAIIYVTSFCFLMFFLLIIQDITRYIKVLKGKK
ncbi:MAG: TRAP transporter small permease [Thermodesulfobacteriota bacterium]|nr:TRAP transporter small permease [Thermodesulfobacteriota bacterium]